MLSARSTPLFSFDQGGVACVITKLGNGDELLPAGYLCKATRSPELWVHWID